MLIVPPQLKVFASLATTDMRKSFHGLIGIIETQLGKQVEDGDLFLFFNRRRDRLKVLFFSGDGTIILYKRLERGTGVPLWLRPPCGDLGRNHAAAGVRPTELLCGGTCPIYLWLPCPSRRRSDCHERQAGEYQ